MRKIILSSGLFALVTVGCASSRSMERQAAQHQAKADEYASSRQYEAAAQEQRKADDLRRRAANRSYEEPTVTPPVAPPPVPFVPPPLDPTIP